MNRIQFVIRSLVAFWRVNLAVSLGVVAATAVLTGALLVGDSMRGSLKKIALDGLGKIDEILLTDRFFRDELTTELIAEPEFSKEFSLAESIVLFPNASAIHKNAQDKKSVSNKVTLIGCQDSFWKFADDDSIFGSMPSFENLAQGETSIPIVINEPLATDLGISADDLQGPDAMLLTVQIPKPQLINADNPIGKKEDLYETIARLRVAKIIPAKSLGRLTLHPTQLLPRILFLPRATVQESVQRDGFSNALVVSGKSGKTGTTQIQSDLLNSLLKPTAEDLGVIFKNVEQSFEVAEGQTETAFQYTGLSSDQLLLTDDVVAIAETSLKEFQPQPVLTYLANGLSVTSETDVTGQNQPYETIPFSMVTAADLTENLELRSAINGAPIRNLLPSEIVINEWAASDFLKIEFDFDNPETLETRKQKYKELIEKNITISYYEPEASHGKLISREAKFKLIDIAKMTQPKSPFNRRKSASYDRCPTWANDPDLTPFVPGVTDQNSVNKWDLPFKTDVRPQDDDYWQFFRTTPKAFVNLSKGQELWKSRFGKVTSMRVYSSQSPEKLAERFVSTARKEGATFGFQFTPIKRRNISASSGSTPFDVLFLALSFFIIASALILIALLFRLGIEQKAKQLGLLAAVGLDRRQVLFLLLAEGALVSLGGALLGMLTGIAYAKLMVYGLTTWWVGAVMTSFMEFHWSIQSLVIGLGVGVLVSLATIWITLRRLRILSARDLLSGRTELQVNDSAPTRTWIRFLPLGCFLVGIVLLTIAATSLGGEAQAGAFMGGGFLMLTAFLVKVWFQFKTPVAESLGLSGNRLAFQNASRNPLRSTLTVGLVAVATFLIVAVSSFHLSPSEEGTGGFEFIAESSRPVIGDFQDPEFRKEILGTSFDKLKDVDIYSLRYLPGDEAGCNNPFQAQRPKILGITEAFVKRFDPNQTEETKGFGWAASTAKTAEEKENPWQLLFQKTDDGSIPVVIDKNTAMYSLKIFGVGGTYQVTLEDGRVVTFRVVGFLSNSTLQGSLIIGEPNFVQTFPTVTGYRVFLIADNNKDNPNADQPELSNDQIVGLENELSTFGFDATNSMVLLSQFLAVQNTYLSTFQSLGAFGLLLGTFGLATVQLRNVVERRHELAVMRAVGFSRLKLGQIVLAEHCVLLFRGMLVGLAAALFSVIPHWLFGDAQIPVVTLGLILSIILIIGLISGLGAVYSSVKTPILSVLRSEN